VDDARDELLAPEPVDTSSLQTSVKETSKTKAKMASAALFLDDKDLENDKMAEILNENAETDK
jgi:hypothetical protein